MLTPEENTLKPFVLFIWIDLEKQLQETSGLRQRLIATDGVFSMDGNVAPLP